jgi:hypothetical protein
MPTLTTNVQKVSRFASVASDDEIARAKGALEANGFKVKIVNTIKEAKLEVEKIIPEQSEVFTASSVTLTESGLEKELNESGRFVSVRDKYMSLYGDPEKAVEMRRIGSGADYAVGSVHGVTLDGQVMIASASGSQLPNYAYGASNVIWVIGSQKIVSDLDEAFDRLETHTLPLEDKRAQAAYGVHSSINKVLIYRKDPNNRVTIILIREAIGF